jgi:dethiobiotin synthetase
MTEGTVIAVSGIDTDIGKTIATGLMGRYLLEKGYKAITQKIAQTGCSGISEDILRHRQLMGIPLQEVDKRGLTCPYIFPVPCSPHLAASLAGDRIDTAKIAAATAELQKEYDYVLLEGVGGLLVPFRDDLTLLDYLEQAGYPLVLVSSPRLGSINHTLAALELAKGRGLTVLGILYNRYGEQDAAIAEDSSRIFSLYLKKHEYPDNVIDLWDYQGYAAGSGPDFGNLFNA